MIETIIETLILSITSFVGTNIDDMFINTLFFSEAETGADRNCIVCGKYLGTGILVLLSILGAFGLQFLPQRFIGCLGLIPIGLGVKEIIGSLKSKGIDEADEDAEKSTNRVINTALITMANGADNIGVYIPLFAGFAVWQILLTVCVFFVFIAVWCFLGKALADLPVLRNLLSKYKTVIVPIVYIALGGYILLKNYM
ncbi:MAG: cadmium resistance transporter [Lachnospiraceae bacterium]|nr:cadmium resistance transporter [Lachnospiraceae bacterium]